MTHAASFPPENFRANLRDRFVTDERLPAYIDELRHLSGKSGVPLLVREIGRSREGRMIHGLVVGSGPRHVSITAGAHADEPTGPMTAIALAGYLAGAGSPEAKRLVTSHTFYLCPQVNPDGSAANEAWFADPVSATSYMQNAVREGPGDDIEFGYPGAGRPALRPENNAVAEFLRPGAPFVYHASLHAMAYAEGAWFLIGKDWTSRTEEIQARLAEVTGELGLPLHDIDRAGDKGFTRIARGFCTTPTASAMREHFVKAGQPQMAGLFHLSSMEFIRSLGGDPLVMVSELPLFLIGHTLPPSSGEAPPPGSTVYELFRAALPEARGLAEQGDTQALAGLLKHYRFRNLSLATHVKLQGLMVLESLELLAN